MLSQRSRYVFVLAVAGLLWLQARSWAQDPQVQEHARVNAPPGPSAALAEMAPGHVVVTYENRQLTIEARNAPLIDVLRAVCSQIGTELDAPPEAREPILLTLGPAPARLVLAALLDGSQLHYAMREAADDPNVLESIIVFPKTKDAKTLGPAAQDSISQRHVNSTTGTTTESGPDQKQLMKELLTQARVELASSGGVLLDPQGGDEPGGDAYAGAQKADAANVLKLVEAQIGAIGDAAAATGADSLQIGPEVGAVAPDNPVSSPRRRRRH